MCLDGFLELASQGTPDVPPWRVGTLEWRDWRGMLWDELVELAFQGTPDVPHDIVIIHLGGNDLPQRGDKALISQVGGPVRVGVVLSWSMHSVVCDHPSYGMEGSMQLQVHQ